MKKVLLFLDYYNTGGIEKVIEQIYYNLSDKYIIDILSFVNSSDNKKIKSILKKDYKNFFIRNYFGLKKLKKLDYYDIIHINAYNAFGLIYAKKFKKYAKRIIVHAHNNDIDKERDKLGIKRIVNCIIRKLYSKNYSLVACSKEAANFCFGRNSLIIFNGVDYNKFKFNLEYRKKYIKKFHLNGKKIIGHVGRFESQKNHEFIIKMFYRLLEKDNNYFLILIGNGSKLEHIKQMTINLNIFDHVLFLDKVNDMEKVINCFDVFILPSLYEGFGISAVENQINDKIVFLSNNISKEIVVSNNTYVLKLDIEEWVSKILNTKKKKLVLDDKLKIEKFIDKIDELYKE